MHRRTFLKTLGLLGLVGVGGAVPHAHAQAAYADAIFLNVMLTGGPDFRHLFVPPYEDNNTSYGGVYWNHRWRSHDLRDNPADWEARWNDDYLHVTHNGQTFGIWSGAAWLAEQFEAGNVAIVNNVQGAPNRNHVHAESIWDTGDRATPLDTPNRDGWGGRLAVALDANVVSMTRSVRQFCYAPHSRDPRLHDSSRIINARNTRNIGLFSDPSLDADPGSTNARARMGRGLESYYAGLADAIDDESIYAPLLQHERTIRAFGDVVDARLEAYPLPEAIAHLYGRNRDNPLNNRDLGEQIRNVYDAIVCADLLNFRIGSLARGGWDTHRDQRGRVESRFSDFFGADRGFATLYRALDETVPGAREQLVTMFGGEFGRQLVANGDQGTDHGRGNSVIIVGDRVNGGIYGDMFPETEIERYLSGNSGDIRGQTHIEPLFAAIAEMMMPGAGAEVFPGYEDMDVEDGVDLSSIFSG